MIRERRFNVLSHTCGQLRMSFLPVTKKTFPNYFPLLVQFQQRVQRNFNRSICSHIFRLKVHQDRKSDNTSLSETKLTTTNQNRLICEVSGKNRVSNGVWSEFESVLTNNRKWKLRDGIQHGTMLHKKIQSLHNMVTIAFLSREIATSLLEHLF